MFFSFLDSQINEFQELLQSNYKRPKIFKGQAVEFEDCSDLIRGRIGALKDIKNTASELRQHVDLERQIKAKILELKKGA